MKDHACPSNVGGVKNRICVTVCSRTSAIDDLRNPVWRVAAHVVVAERRAPPSQNRTWSVTPSGSQ
jgi:hypothetical protein